MLHTQKRCRQTKLSLIYPPAAGLRSSINSILYLLKTQLLLKHFFHTVQLFLYALLAVCQLMNKLSRDSDEMEAFNRYDERLLEDLAVYCGLALQYVQAVQITEERRASIEVTQEVSVLLNIFGLPFRSLSWSQMNLFRHSLFSL